MASMFRSEEMVLCQLFLQPESAYSCLAELGDVGVAQFRDLNVKLHEFKRQYVTEVRRCTESERRLRYIAGEISKEHVPVPESSAGTRRLSAREITLLEERIDFVETELQELSQNENRLKTNYLQLIELQLIIEKTQGFFSDQHTPRKFSSAKAAYDDDSIGHLGFLTGVVDSTRLPAFEQMLWRISHGNVFFRYTRLEESLEDPTTGTELHKTVFVVFFHGKELKVRVKKVCNGFKATLYPCPNSYKDQQELLANVKTRIQDLKTVLAQTKEHRSRFLVNIASDLKTWITIMRMEKAIYHTLNMFSLDIVKKCLIGECWVPLSEIAVVQKALNDGMKASGGSIPSFLNYVVTEETPPTFNKTNKYTKGFQALIDSYGIARYREVNPALYTLITFPFLFAVMFGDVGHGLLMTLFAAFMILKEKKYLAEKSDNEIWVMFFAGRYIIFLMGVFSLYTGFIYNDFFSKSLNIFGTEWSNMYNSSTLMTNKQLQLDPKIAFSQTPYPIGLDPAWQFAENNIIYLNSLKMKLSIIFGVCHMAFGVSLSVINFDFFRNRASIFLEFLPQILFLVLLFWYLCLMMFMKWIMYSAVDPDPVYTPSCAPSILILFINMMLMKSPAKGKEESVCKEFMFNGQFVLQRVLLFTALLCIPVMLFGKPLYILFSQRRSRQKSLVEANGEGGVKELKKEEVFSELMIYQGIHTIEYVLGTVSHTASYLRLWALSLAHARLSAVLWQQVMVQGLRWPLYVGAPIIFVIFAAWASFTIAILVLMEGLSAFLHTLRLHWVEFMSKFYQGNGYAFQPFSFKTIFEEHDERDVRNQQK